MGFFSFIGSALKTVVKVGAAAAAFVVAPIPTAVAAGAYAMYKLTKSTPIETATAMQVEDINATLQEYSKTYLETATKSEENCRKYVDVCFTKMTNILHENEKFTENFVFEKLRRQQRELSGKINGSITEPLRRRLSIDDNECIEILNLTDHVEKERRMKAFTQNVIKEASDDLSKKVSSILEQQANEICEFVTNQLAEEERHTQQKKDEFDAWIGEMQRNSFDQEQAQLAPKIKLQAIKQVEEIMAA